MDFDNSVYSVTPPSLFLNENGPSIMLLGFHDSEVQQVSRVFDFSHKTVLLIIMIPNL
jgi:hypothetical protein